MRDRVGALPESVFHEGASLYREVQALRNGWKEHLYPLQGAVCPVGNGIPSLRLRKKSPLHSYYPLLFRSAFPEVPGNKARELAIADRLYTEHLLSHDAVLDRKDGKSPAQWFLALLEHVHSLKRLYRLFPSNHPFWDTFASCFHQTWEAVRAERLHHLHRLQSFSYERFQTLAKGKSALLKPFTLALCFLSNRKQDLSLVSDLLDHHHVGLVLLDDLEDWREDILRSNFTYLLTTLIHEQGLGAQVLQEREIPLAKLGALLYGSRLAERQLEKAQACFDRAMIAPAGLHLPDWQSFNQGLVRHCTALRFDLAKILRRGIRKAGTSKRNGAPVSQDKRECSPEAGIQAKHTRRKLSATVLHKHDRLPGSLCTSVSPVMEWWRSTFPQQAPEVLYLGQWPTMPSHFVCHTEAGGQVAVNVAHPLPDPCTSTAARPLETEAMMACVANARIGRTGAFKDNMERLYALGASLWMLERMGTESPAWDLAGAKKLQWLWCEEQEKELWDWVRPQLGGSRAPCSPFHWLFPLPDLAAGDPIPACMPLYLGMRIFQAVRSRSLHSDPAVHLFLEASSIRKDLGRYGLS